jgi:transposase
VQQPAEHVTLRSEEVESLLAHVHQRNVPAAVAGRLGQILRTCLWLLFALQETTITVGRLRRVLFGKAFEASAPAPQEALAPRAAGGDATHAGAVVDAGADDTAATRGEAPPRTSPLPSQDTPQGGHRPGPGRQGAEAYVGAERAQCRHEDLAPGQRCPVCGQGTLYELPPGVEIRIDGHALLSAIRDALEKLRCAACGQMFTAPLPSEAGEETYSPRARAVLVVGRYSLGLPFYRLEGDQAMLGVPMPDATQWDQIERVGDCCYVVFACLETLAAQGELIHQADTSVRILPLMQENQQMRAAAAAQGVSRAQERPGMFTTALVVRVGERLICLYYSGRAHAGENLAAWLEQRQADLEPPLAMSDALSRNEVAAGLVIRCHCLAHGRRQFSDLAAVFPSECRVVIDALKQVFDHDEEAREQRMSAEARLAYQQAQSQPLMDELKGWLDYQLADRLVEPNSALGQAITDMQNYWQTLTRFLSLPGAPLDNNLVERALKLFIRQRKNSLVYRSEHSADIASVLTSLIVTCLYAGGNVVDYFVAVQEHRAEVFVDPEAWLPWTYCTSRASP